MTNPDKTSLFRSQLIGANRLKSPKHHVFFFTATLLLAGCAADVDDDSDDDTWNTEGWNADVTITDDHLLISATIADIHGDFIHVTIRREGYDSGYTVERSPSPNQPERDWSRVHHWFGELHPNTYLEGRIDDGSGRGPRALQTFRYEVPRESSTRENYPDLEGSDYELITRGYSYADGNSQHPPFDAGRYELEIYAWYTGRANALHPAMDGREGVQYIHYERSLVSTEFVID